MGAALTKGCIKRPVTVLVCLIAMVIFAIISITNITLQLMPEINYPMINIMTSFPGANPEEQDDLVASKIEDAVSTLSGVNQTFVETFNDYSYVIIRFEFGTDMDKTYDEVKKRVDRIKSDLPKDAQDPMILEVDMNGADDVTLSVTAAGEGVDVLNAVKENVEPELNKIGAAARVEVSGGDERYIKIELIPEYMSQYGLDLSAVSDAIAAVNFAVPAGRADYGDQRVNLSAKSEFKSIPELEQVPITTSTGKVIHLSDIARINYAITSKTSLSRYNGQSNVSIGLKRKQTSNSVALSRQLKKVLPGIKSENPNLQIDVVNDAADTIIDSLLEVGKTLALGIVLSMVVLFLFFGDFKASCIVGSSMPISLLITIVLMDFCGFSLNVVTMSALVIGIGMMVDNSIVVIEMCFRKRDEGFTFADAAYEGTKIVIGSITGSTITTVVVYLPMARMQGLSGQLFGQLGLTIVFSLLASLVAAMTMIPFFFSKFQPVEKKGSWSEKVLTKMSEKYGRILPGLLRKKKTVLLVSILMIAGTIALATQIGLELMAATDEGMVNIDLSFRPNMSLEEIDSTVMRLEEFIAEQPEVERYTSNMDETNSSGSIVAYRDKDIKISSQVLADKWNTELQDFSEVCELKCTSGSSTGMSSINSGATKELNIRSTDREQLREGANMLKDMMENVPGVLHVESSMEESGSKAEIVIDPIMARAKGFTPQQLSGLVYKNMSGSKVMDVDLNGEEYEVRVELPSDMYENVSDMNLMTFRNSKGVSIPLMEMAEIRFTSSAKMIEKQDGFYSATVKATATKATIDEIGKKIDDLCEVQELPAGVEFADSSYDAMLNDEVHALVEAILIAVFLVFMVMAIQFESMVYSLLIMLCIPFSLIGSIILMYVTGQKFSMTSLMGIMMLAGIVVNDGILYVDTTNQMREGGKDIHTALVETGKSRLRPILMTSLTTILSMLPVAFGTSDNAASMKGMAFVIIGGLVASTLLTLLLLPTFYLLVQRFRKKVKKKRRKRFFGLVKEKEMNIAERTRTNPTEDDMK